MPLEYAREMAGALVELLALACVRIEVAGSVRRQNAKPNDVEIVCEPRLTDQGRNLCDLACEDLLRTGQLEKRPDSRGRYCWGTGIKRAIFYQGGNYAPVDLFQVIEPRQWGVIYAIRTGPGEFNRLLVTSRRWGGGCPLDRKVAGGRVWFIDPGREDLARMPAKVRPPGRAGLDRGDDDPHAGGGGFLPRAGRTLLAATRTNGGTPSPTSAADVGQESLAWQPGAFSVHRAQINQFLSPVLHTQLGDHFASNSKYQYNT
jgi:hypothetical protein